MDVEKLEDLDRKFELFKEKMGSTNHPFTRDTLDFLDKHRPNKAFQYWALVMLQRELDRAHTEGLASQIWDLEGRINELLGHGAAVIKERDELRAKANAVPEGFVLVPKESITHFWQDNDEPENFCSKESDFDCLGDGVDIGDVLIVNKYKQANIGVEKLFGVWCSCEPKPFTRSTIEFRLFETHAEAKQAMIEALEVK